MQKLERNQVGLWLHQQSIANTHLAISILLDAVRELQYENPTVITVALKVLSNFVLKPSPLGINK